MSLELSFVVLPTTGDAPARSAVWRNARQDGTGSPEPSEPSTSGAERADAGHWRTSRRP